MDLNNHSSWTVCKVLNSKLRYPIEVESWPKVFYISYVIFIIFNLVFAVLTISLNSVTILAYWKSMQLRKRSSYFLIMLLSITDLATGMFGNVGSVIKAEKIMKKDIDCLFFTLLQLISFTVAAMSVMTSFLLNAERYLSIVHPFFHRRAVTKSKLFITAVVLWCIVILVVNSQIAMNQITAFFSSAAILLIIVACVYFYVAIFWAKQKAGKKCRSSEDKNPAGKITQAQDMKLAKSCTIVIACAIICFVPFAVTNPVITHSYVKYSLRDVANTLAFASATFNSLVFFWQNRSLRNEAKKALTLRAS